MQEPVAFNVLLEEFDGDRELISTIMEMFLEDLGDNVNGLKAAVANGEQEEVRKKAHRLKGGASNIAATGLEEMALNLENVAKSKASDSCEGLVAEVEVEAARVSEFIRTKILTQQ